MFGYMIVREFEETNAFFQGTDQDPSEMFEHLSSLQRSLEDRILTKDGTKLGLTQVDYGARVQPLIIQYLTQKKHSPEAKKNVQEFQERFAGDY